MIIPVRKSIIVSAFIIIALAVAVFMKACQVPSSSVQEVIIAVSADPLSAPVFVAQEKGFFQEEGLRVTLQKYTTGIDAMHSVIGGKAQFATVADVPIMFAGLKGERLLIVATISDDPGHVKIVARKNRGIARPADLRGKTIAAMPGTSSGYFLNAFLTFNAISEKDVSIVDMRLVDMADALAAGKIDAAASWDPQAAAQQKALGGNAVTFTNKYIYKVAWNFVASPDYIKAHPEVVEKLLRALIQATVFLRDSPEEGFEITARGIGRSDFSFGEIHYDVHLEQALLVNLDAQARWAIRSGLTSRKEVPNYLHMLYTKGIEKVRPEAITVIRR